jgi:UPF0042 nucleotide-binding protein
MKRARLVIITGMSGSGKTVASRALEDLGYFVIDNLPIDLLPKLIELGNLGRGDELARVALVMDLREPSFPERAIGIVSDLQRQDYRLEIVFLDASDEVLQRRYSETRRTHPSAGVGSVADGIRIERARLANLKLIANFEIDTSTRSPHELRRAIQDLFAEDGDAGPMRIRLMSFGFGLGRPGDADLIMDVRFLPNPYYTEELKPLTGRDPQVAEFVLRNELTQDFLRRFVDLLAFLIPLYQQERRGYLTIAVGCTGGQHRSVAIVEELSHNLRAKNILTQVTHRDLRK